MHVNVAHINPSSTRSDPSHLASEIPFLSIRHALPVILWLVSSLPPPFPPLFSRNPPSLPLSLSLSPSVSDRPARRGVQVAVERVNVIAGEVLNQTPCRCLSGEEEEEEGPRHLVVKTPPPLQL